MTASPRWRWGPLLLAPIVMLGCDTITVGTPPAPPPSAPNPGELESPNEGPGDAACVTLDRARCMRSVVCTLAAPTARSSDRYVCRPASGNCEIGLRQTSEDQDRCTSRTGCRWRQAPCYCACRGAARTDVEDAADTMPCDCECRGGPPPGCTPRI